MGIATTQGRDDGVWKRDGGSGGGKKGDGVQVLFFESATGQDFLNDQM